jgi:XTP/dITP diphosphohydrolase
MDNKSLQEKIVLASKNHHKLQEIREIFNNQALQGLDAYPGIEEASETGTTFQENAIIKAIHYYNRIKLPVIAEDSGLVVPALQGAPGIYSARYTGPDATAAENNRKLLQEMKNIPEEQRGAYFICCVVYFDGHQTIPAEGRVAGVITRAPRGTNGFGYDPVFLIPQYGMTFAELGPAIKNKISHRREALLELKNKLISTNIM